MAHQRALLSQNRSRGAETNRPLTTGRAHPTAIYDAIKMIAGNLSRRTSSNANSKTASGYYQIFEWIYQVGGLTGAINFDEHLYMQQS
jgi:hypothetical protein